MFLVVWLFIGLLGTSWQWQGQTPKLLRKIISLKVLKSMFIVYYHFINMHSFCEKNLIWNSFYRCIYHCICVGVNIIYYNMIYSSRRLEHITPLLRELHWLKVPQRIQFRLCVLTYRCLHGTAPAYLSDSLHSVADIDAHRRLHSADTSTLLVPSTWRSTVGDRAFPVAAARAWNALPVTVCGASTLSAFCRQLKTHFYRSTFD